MSPFNSFLLLLGLETLGLRMQRHVENAAAVAEFLSSHDAVSWVQYPTLNEWLGLSEKYLPKGPGAVFTFGVEGGYEAGVGFIERVDLASHLANIGDAKTLVIHPGSTTHGQMTPDQLEMAGISEDLVRLSVGLEDPEDIVEDLERALKASQR